MSVAIDSGTIVAGASPRGGANVPGQGFATVFVPTLSPSPLPTPSEGGAAGGGATGGGSGGVVLGFGSKTLMSLQLAARRIPATGPLKIRIGNGEPFEITGMLWAETASKVSVSRARRIKLQVKTFKVGAHTSKTVALKLPKVLQRLLARGHRLELRLTAEVKDPAGHTRRVDKRVAIRSK